MLFAKRVEDKENSFHRETSFEEREIIWSEARTAKPGAKPDEHVTCTHYAAPDEDDDAEGDTTGLGGDVSTTSEPAPEVEGEAKPGAPGTTTRYRLPKDNAEGKKSGDARAEPQQVKPKRRGVPKTRTPGETPARPEAEADQAADQAVRDFLAGQMSRKEARKAERMLGVIMRFEREPNLVRALVAAIEVTEDMIKNQ